MLLRLLHALESGQPVLFVKALAVDAARGLTLSLDVAGYRRSLGTDPISRVKWGLSPKGQGVKAVELAPMEAFAEVAERTLFEPARRPAQAAAQARLAGGGDAQGLTLVGVVLSPHGRLAVLRDGGEAERLGPGETIGEWKVEAVHAEGVVLRRGAERRELLLHVKELP